MKTKNQRLLQLNTHVLKLLILLASTSTCSIAQTTISFDNASLWASGSGTISSYQVDRVYKDADWTFTGGEALRQFTGTQDGFDRTNSGNYAWRLRDNSCVVWTATHDTCGIITSFGFAVRR